MSLSEKYKNFDPNGLGTGDNLYGLPFSVDEANLVIIPVPWEVTVSYNAGTAEAPAAIFDASFQVDLYDPLVKDAWKSGIAMDNINHEIKSKGRYLRGLAERCIELQSRADDVIESRELSKLIEEVNEGGAWLTSRVKQEAAKYLLQGKMVAVLGGDHSTPLGLIQALAEQQDEFGILQIDAHADLRIAYEDFEFSHASIMHNVLKIPQIKQLVQVGVRDYCEAEADYINTDSRVHTFFDHDLKNALYEGISWAQLCTDIIKSLPKMVYLSVDIDGLDPRYCPNTGTPVPGGLEYDQLVYLLQRLVESGKKIIGFDLNEVAPGSNEWDANVGARLLYRIANLTLASQK